MEYSLNPLSWSTISIFLVVILWSQLSAYFGSSLLLFLLYLLVVIVFASSIRFKFKIHVNHLVYQVLLFKKSIIKKKMAPDQVEQMKFIRAGWAKKAAIIKLEKGMDIRLAVIYLEEAYEHLLEFAEKHDISIVKTNDYLTLERKGARNKMEIS
ncbi:hypothetical protein ACTNEO_10755 [Gracilibacillus sp. HCP3S3_G5_1]|uniref:hypothetical protein n=1 Tax=unclassified Gracilibacillus TaxID=2625209 RepID=UPI003F8BA8E7